MFLSQVNDVNVNIIPFYKCATQGMGHEIFGPKLSLIIKMDLHLSFCLPIPSLSNIYKDKQEVTMPVQIQFSYILKTGRHIV